MIAMVQVMEEGKGKQALAALSGVGGALTGGNIVGGIQGHQRTQGRTAEAASKGDTKEALAQSKKGPGRMIRRSLAGAIPGVGAVSNYQQQKKLDNMRQGYDTKKTK